MLRLLLTKEKQLIQLNRSLYSGRMTRTIFSGVEHFRPGYKSEGFVVKEVNDVTDLNLRAITLEHEKSKAHYLHLARDDTNNAFGVAFTTIPTDSTGVPHILEHTVLCGSEKYPVRDPFFKMLNRSLSNYMNALTASDCTLYPFATENLADLKNLRSVYLDSLFRPRLRELDFKQEGWRLEHENPKDQTSPIIFKGVVYNEMKGAMSDISSLFHSKLQRVLHPGTTYSHESGGDPCDITNLTYQQLKDFHALYYHPSNSKFLSYGNASLEDHLKAVNEYIQTYDFCDKDFSIKDITSIPEGKYSTRCPVDPLLDPKKQTHMCLSYITNDAADVYETLVMQILVYLLTDGPSSPMYKSLIESNIGSEYAASTGYNNYTKRATCSFGLQGLDPKDCDKVKEIIESTLKQSALVGFDKKRIDAAIHQIELSRKHKTAQFGLSLLQRIAFSLSHNAHPLELLKVQKHIHRLQENLLKDSKYLQKKIEKYFVTNTSKLTFIMNPDKEYDLGEKKEEQERLQKELAKLSDKDKSKIYEQGLELLKWQEKKEDLSCLPTLTLKDISPNVRSFELQHDIVEKSKVQLRKTATNGITYFKLIGNMGILPAHLRPYVPLFCDALTQLGTEKKTISEIDEEIRMYTGGISFSPFINPHHSDLNSFEEGISISSHCLDRNVDKMYELTRTLMKETNFQNENILTTIIKSNATNMSNSLADSGHQFSRKYASASLTPSGKLFEIYGGITQVIFMNKLAKEIETTGLKDIISKLKLISSHIFDQMSARVAITCEPDQAYMNVESLGKFLKGIKIKEADTNKQAAEMFTTVPNKTILQAPFGVNYSSQCFRVVPYTHPDSGKLQVLSKLLSSLYLHKEIREKCGAYGGGARYLAQDGIFAFFSYRDPNSLKTVETYNTSLEWALKREFTPTEMTEAKLSIFSSIDSPISVFQEGMSYFSSNLTDDMRQKHREAILAVTQESIKEMIPKYFLNKESVSSVALLGPASTLDTTRKDSGWTLLELGKEM